METTERIKKVEYVLDLLRCKVKLEQYRDALIKEVEEKSTRMSELDFKEGIMNWQKKISNLSVKIKIVYVNISTI